MVRISHLLRVVSVTTLNNSEVNCESITSRSLCDMFSNSYFCVGAGLVGRNGTGKTTLLKHMAMHAIDGIPRNCQILHVEQEVVGDDTTVLQCVLDSDVERKMLMEEEAQLAQQVCYLFPLCL